MEMRGSRSDADAYEASLPGTIYWTLSLYVSQDKVASALKLRPGRHLDSSVFRRAQVRHLPSLALRNAIEPLMNDIADREMRGEVQEYLFAGTSEDRRDLDDAAALIREHEELVFRLPPSTTWTTEGIRFEARPAGLDDLREVRLRRFWLSHNDGALSYHLSFTHHYGAYRDTEGQQRSGYDPSTYYFLSLLQKLAAPKEYALDTELLRQTIDADQPYVDVLSGVRLGIDPLDNIRIGPASVSGDGANEKFWPFVNARFESDARGLFARLAREMPSEHTPDAGFEKRLLDLVPFVEVPGLAVPRSRFMFMLHDPRFFDRLMPMDPATHEQAPRKQMVQDKCFADYQARIAATKALSATVPGRDVSLDGAFWDWAVARPEYAVLLAHGAFAVANSAFDVERAEGAGNPRWTVLAPEDVGGLVAAMRGGTCYQLRDDTGRLLAVPLRRHLPQFTMGREDCLDYLFLAGFNQNIIDFMNQDTSEVLDSIDPIYPDSDEQSDERFFVRYANHRAMITYVPRSRSLEIGNDYIGTCPYAFLIHVLALHNEFLARSHEEKSLARIDRIEALITGCEPRHSKALDTLNFREPLEPGSPHDQAEFAINQAKLAEFNEYERFRYANPFRYDTERVVFAKLEELRGTRRKTEALALAIHSLEDHTSDLQRRQQQTADREEAKRDARLNILLGGTGVFGAGQMIYWIGEKAAGEKSVDPVTHLEKVEKARGILAFWFPISARSGEAILSAVEMAMALALVAFVPLLLWIIFDMTREVVRQRRVARSRALLDLPPGNDGRGGH
ncbi:MAG: hypothetical protein QM681_03795 [Novosphingobium sp.]